MALLCPPCPPSQGRPRPAKAPTALLQAARPEVCAAARGTMRWAPVTCPQRPGARAALGQGRSPRGSAQPPESRDRTQPTPRWTEVQSQEPRQAAFPSAAWALATDALYVRSRSRRAGAGGARPARGARAPGAWSCSDRLGLPSWPPQPVLRPHQGLGASPPSLPALGHRRCPWRASGSPWSGGGDPRRRGPTEVPGVSLPGGLLGDTGTNAAA